MHKLSILVVITGCATAGMAVPDTTSTPHARVRLELTGSTDTTAVFPAPIDPAVPSVDRIGREVRGTLGDAATAELDLCVSAAGKVTKATLASSSTFADFDRSLLRDVAAWQFVALPGPASVQSCERAKVTYRPY